MKTQQEGNENSVTGNSEDCTGQTHRTIRQKYNDSYQQNSSSAVGNQAFILGYSSATPDNHQQNPSSTVAN